MTTAAPTTAARIPTAGTRTTARVAGAFYLLTFVASIPALILIGPVLDNSDYIVSGGSDARVVLGCLLDVVNAFAGIGTAVTLFPVLKRQNEASALGFVTSRVIEAAVIMIGVVCLLAVVTLRQDVAGTAGTDPATLVTTGKTLVAVRDWTFLLGPGLMPAMNALLLGSLLLRSRLVPRFIPAIGLIGAPLLLISALSTLFGAFDQVSSAAAALNVPIAVWEFLVGVYLLCWGFRPAPVTGDQPR
ncbi:DUF4386 domain-containing protein [Dactylosporangium sp. CA-092794]|uniref:DUF4386 domain-containing protein n=1 Tax=Dactylosporangium sp. CA-092794 TaxID=3239929 RepID=UPI003D8F3C6F